MNSTLRLIAFTWLLALAPRGSDASIAWRDSVYTTHERPSRPVSVQMARLTVPENVARPNGATVDLLVLRLPAATPAPGIPTVYLHGGPGGSSAEHLEQPAFRALFDSLRTRGDVVMFDQRGCGGSRPSLVPADAPRARTETLATREAFLRYLEQVSKTVRDRLVQAGHDPKQFTVLNSVEDIEALRRALGVEKINLLGHSYGTQLAQAYVRAYPHSVARLVLIGARGMDTARKLPAEADESLRRIAGLARADTTVGARFPDLVATLDRVLAKLDRAPLAVELEDGDRRFTLEVGGYALRFIVAKFYLNDPDNFRYLPKMLDESDQGRRPWSLIFNLGQILRGGVSLAWFTTDGASGVTAARAETIRAQARGARLQDAMNFPFPDINRVWGVQDLGDGFREPVRSDVPALFVAGTLDGITPVSQTREIMKGFSDSRLLLVENGGHSSQLRAPGVAGDIAGFMAGRNPPETARLSPVEFVPLIAKQTPKAD
jgi:pimeloyl-ACP methyl ester carboxylesterase